MTLRKQAGYRDFGITIIFNGIAPEWAYPDKLLKTKMLSIFLIYY